VIFATGYRPDLGFLAGLGALGEKNRVLQQQGRSTSVPGLYYSGLPRQRTAASATLRGVGSDALVVVDHLWQYCSVSVPRAGLFARASRSLTSARI
jgi:putative flavoprotein involved in K+ transport